MKTSKLKGYSILYPNEKEFKILQKEIFNQEIYDIDLKTDSPIIFDIGAYIGLSAIYFKDKYPNAQIKAFEPNPNVFHILEDNIYGNGLQNIELFNIAIDKKETTKDLYIDATGQDCFSTASFKKNAWNGEQKSLPIKIQTKPLSEYITDRIDLIKIDTEGNEIQILEEIEDKLTLVENLIIEYHPNKKTRVTDLTKILERNNFLLEFILEGKAIQEPIEELLIIKATKV